jgi:hypothetical protein
MTMTKKLFAKTLVAASVAATALFCNGDISATPTVSFASPAQAWIGAPATPRSFAGVARRTTRRSVATGVAVGATAAAGVATVGVARAATVGATTAAVAASNCVRVIGPYGRTAVVCR